MSKILTAKQIIDKNFWNGKYVEGDSLDVHEQLMIEFAKLHVEAAIKECIECAPSGSSTEYEDVVEALTKCYSLTNIK